MNYTWNGSICNANTKVTSCIGNPLHSAYNTATSITQTWDGSTWMPVETATYSIPASLTECKFICNSNFEWDGSSCNVNKCILDSALECELF